MDTYFSCILKGCGYLGGHVFYQAVHPFRMQKKQEKFSLLDSPKTINPQAATI
jgi:hypothetical protein